MEEIAERGFAAHWKYKSTDAEGRDEGEFDRWIKQVREALNSPTENAVEFLDNFKLSLYTNEIVVFTPKGESRTLPQGATALDFAYDIHTNIGNSAIGAKINHKIESILHRSRAATRLRLSLRRMSNRRPTGSTMWPRRKRSSASSVFSKGEDQ